jgi:hypothetical protein
MDMKKIKMLFKNSLNTSCEGVIAAPLANCFRFGGLSMAVAFTIFSTQSGTAQPFFNAPLTLDYGIGNFQSNVLNTGTENGIRFNGSTFDQVQVVVWDGDRPGWNFIEENTQGSPNISGPFDIGDISRGIVAEDPDIVFDHSTGTHVMIVYHANVSGIGSNTYYEIWDVLGTPTRIVGPTFVSLNPSGFEHHANVDVGLQGTTAVIWQDDASGLREVKVNTFDFNGLTFGPTEFEVVISGFLPISEAFEPDVAVSDFADPIIHIVCNTFNSTGTSQDVWSFGISWLDLRFFTVTFPLHLNIWQSYSTTIGNWIPHPPRISGGYNHINDHAVTYGATDGVEYFIQLGVRDFNTVTTNTFTSSTPINGFPITLIFEPNLRPAISYVGDIIMVAWTYNDASLGQIRGVEEVLVKQYFPDGTPLTSTLDYYAYLIDQNPQGGNTVSVAGRYNSRGSYFAWHHLDGPQVLFKNADWQTLNLRKGSPETVFAAQIDEKEAALPYPNPFSDHLKLTSNGEPTVMQITLHDVLGRLHHQQTFGIFDEKVIPTSTLAAGMYTLTITTSHGKEQHKVVKR